MDYTVYILQSESSGRLYIGHTSDLERRLAEHGSGQTRSTRSRGPWQLLYQRPFATRAEAMRYERMLKGWKSRTRVLQHIEREQHPR